MGSRARRFGPGSSSRGREEHPRGRHQEEPPNIRDREGRFASHARRELPPNRNNKESGNIRERERPPEFRTREESSELHKQESARERIRRENEEHERSRERSRSQGRRVRKQSGERHSSKGRTNRSSERRKGRSIERRAPSGERRSGGPRFEPPLQKGTFARRRKSSSKDRPARYSPPREDIQFVEEVSGIPNRFSPPAPEIFHAKEEFDPRSNFNQDMFREMTDTISGPFGTGGSIAMNNQGFPPVQHFVPQLVIPQQPLMGKQEFSQNPGMNTEFSRNLSMGDPGFQSPFIDNPLQGFPGHGRIEMLPDNSEDPLIPEYNPETSKLTSHEWVKLIDDTARKYDWKKDEKQYIMASRLAGFARQWYLSSGVNCKGWGDLRQAFLVSFPTEMGFHSLLTKMLARVKDENESMASYFHHKVALLNACDILGRKAVSCLIAGLPTVKLRLQAKSQNFEDPDELYLYLRSFDPETPVKKQQQKNTSPDDSKYKNSKANAKCYSCGSVGHMKYQCPRQKLKMEHQAEEENDSGLPHHNKVMHGSLSRKPTYPKYFTDVIINGVSLKAYVDQGSECTTIREENANLLKLPIKKQYKVVGGFAGSALSSIGFVDLPLCIDRAIANMLLFVVPDHLQAIPVVVGQSFTEQPHVVVMKDGGKIRFYQRMDNGKTNFDF